MYTVKVLSEKDFDKLPYKHTKTSLGMADAKTGVAYVRDTGYNDITKETINHEFDELMASVSPHEEDGIRYKNLASLGGGAGAGLLSNMIPMLKPFAPLISAGAGAALNKDNRWQGAMQGFTGGGIGQTVGSGLGGSIKGLTDAGGTFGKAMKSFMPSAGTGFNNYIGAIPGMGGYGTDDPKGKLSQWLSGAGGSSAASGGSTGFTTSSGAPTAGPTGGKGTGQPLVGASSQDGGSMAANFAKSMAGNSGAASTLDPSKGKGALGGFNLGDTLKDLVPGLAIAGIGDMASKDVQAPDFSNILGGLNEKMQTGGEPLAKEAGLKELFSGLDPNTQMSGFAQGDTRAEEQLVQDLKNFDSSWKAIRPGADISNDAEYQAQRQEIIRKSGNDRIEARDAQQLEQMYNYMQTALNLDSSQMNQYIQLAQLEVDQLMIQYGLEAEEAMRFKQMFADFGRASMGGQSEISQLVSALGNQGGTA